MKGKAGALLKVQARGDRQEDHPRRREKDAKSGKSYSVALSRTGSSGIISDRSYLAVRIYMECWNNGVSGKGKNMKNLMAITTPALHYSITPRGQRLLRNNLLYL